MTRPSQGSGGQGEQPPPAARDFLATACRLAGQLSPEVCESIAKAWPTDDPHPAVVAHMLAVMLADTDRHVSRGFLRMPLDRAMDAPKPTSPGQGAGLTGEASLRHKVD